MAHAREEVEEMVSIASALVLNIGTLTPKLVEAMAAAGKKANELGVPVVLDAVGAGATRLRTDSTVGLLREFDASVLKGNASEIGTVAGAEAHTKGVESLGVKGDIKEIAEKVALEHSCTVVVTGKTDIATDGKTTALVGNGHQMMGLVVGTGCMAASAIGCFCGVEKDRVSASAAALSCFGIAGEIAAEKAKAPMAFKTSLSDCVFGLDESKVNQKSKITFA
jgi:hydroxyethylthiazole kinase